MRLAILTLLLLVVASEASVAQAAPTVGGSVAGGDNSLEVGSIHTLNDALDTLKIIRDTWSLSIVKGNRSADGIRQRMTESWHDQRAFEQQRDHLSALLTEFQKLNHEPILRGIKKLLLDKVIHDYYGTLQLRIAMNRVSEFKGIESGKIYGFQTMDKEIQTDLSGDDEKMLVFHKLQAFQRSLTSMTSWLDLLKAAIDQIQDYLKTSRS